MWCGTKRSYWQYASLGLVLAMVSIGWYGYRWHYPADGIYPFDPARELPFVETVFRDNRYWLVDEASAPDFDVAYTFSHRATSYNPQDWDKMQVSMYREQGEPRGFVAYYKTSFDTGKIRFVAVAHAHRGKGYAEKLMQFALDDLEKQGSKSVWIVTRTDNTAAQRLYKKFGFVAEPLGEGFLRFEKKLA